MGAAFTTEDGALANARLPLAQRFRPVGGGMPFLVVVNHFKSKNCGGATGANTDQTTGRAATTPTESSRWRHWWRWSTRSTSGRGSHRRPQLLRREDPIDVLEEAGYLDHAFVSESMVRRVTGEDIWHVSADEAHLLDYNTEFNPQASSSREGT